MTTFTVDSDDHIATATGDRTPEAADHFTSLDELHKVGAQWPVSRLVRLWNGLPGVTPVSGSAAAVVPADHPTRSASQPL